MSKKGPILLIDDDTDECELLKEALRVLKIENEVRYFADGKDGLDYLNTTIEQPFLIISDINIPRMSGLELRREIMSDPVLRQKSIPFVFLSTTAAPAAVKEAFDLNVQGFFEKPQNMASLRTMLLDIYNYWQTCKHPNL